MKNRNEKVEKTAIMTTRAVVVIYAVIKIALFIIAEDPSKWFYRIAACAAMVFLTFAVTGLKLSNRATAILTSISIALAEIVWCAAFQNGEWLIYIFLVGCSLICLLYLDSTALLVFMTITSGVMAFCSFGLGIVMSGSGLTAWDDLYGFAGLIIVNTLIYFIARYSVGAFSRFEQTGQTFDKVLETTPSYMVIINEKAVVKQISVSLARWLGVSHWEYAIDRPLFDLCHSGEMKVMFQEVMESIGYVEKSFELSTGEGKRWLLLRSSLIGEGRVARIFELADISPIMEAKNLAEAATRAKSDFLANMSHEIRTPMNAIVGMTELIMLKPLDQEQLSHAVSIKGAAMSLLKIINDILDFSKIDAQKMEIINKPFDFSSLINDTVNMINIKTGSTGIAFTTNISKDIPPLIVGDELRIKQVLINILNNAVKFTKEGSVSLSINSEFIENGALKLNFVVEDTGIGIKREDMGKLFGEFQQLDTHKNRNIVGTGLGLAITHRLIELMGGAVSVESVYGKGSAFSFYIVCHGEHTGTIVSLPDPEKYNVICYEPNRYRLEALKAMFENLGVSYKLCGDTGVFKQELSDAAYTHVFFDETASQVIENCQKYENTSYILMKEVDSSATMTMNFINRPILIMGLVQLLKGYAGNEEGAAITNVVRLGAFKTKNARVLIVDDNPINLTVAEGMIRQYGIEVITANGGKQAIEMAKEEAVDIIFMDHMMPEIDGIEATKIIRASGCSFCDTPIIALTANAISGIEEQFFEAGMNDFMSKPIIVKRLHKLLLKYIPAEKVITTE